MQPVSRLLPTISRALLRSPDDRVTVLKSLMWELPRLSYQRLRERGFDPRGIIDIGAHRGTWAQLVRPIFPEASLLMIEARASARGVLDAVAGELGNAACTIALLGPMTSEAVPFYCGDDRSATGSSRFRERSNANHKPVMLPMTTLDRVLAESQIKLDDPLFIKLDLQGGELDVLRGAAATMARAEIIQMEVALMRYNEGAPLAAEAVSFMDDHGFCLYDVNGFVRPTGAELVQIDALFARKGSALRSDFFRFN